MTLALYILHYYTLCDSGVGLGYLRLELPGSVLDLLLTPDALEDEEVNKCSWLFGSRLLCMWLASWLADYMCCTLA